QQRASSRRGDQRHLLALRRAALAAAVLYALPLPMADEVTMKQLAAVAGSHSAPRGSTASLIMALVVAPVIVSLSFTVGIAFSRAGCQPAPAVLRSGSALLAIIAAIAGGVAAMRRWR